jgi:hypothetical protein
MRLAGVSQPRGLVLSQGLAFELIGHAQIIQIAHLTRNLQHRRVANMRGFGRVKGESCVFWDGKRPGGHAPVSFSPSVRRWRGSQVGRDVLTQHAECGGSQVGTSPHSHHVCAETGVVPRYRA